MRSLLSVLVLLALFTSTAPGAIPTEEISAVRERALASDGSISASDKAAIDKFLRSAIDAIFLNEDSAQVAEIRQQIRTQKGDQDLSMYASTYLDIIRDHLRTAFAAADRIQDPQKKRFVTRNLVILVAELRSLLLAEFGLAHLDNPDLITRYWAVKSVAGGAIVGQLNQEVTNVPETATQIFEALQPMVQADNPPEIQVLLINYAGSWNDERAAGMLTQITQRRISAYKDWSVKNAWLETPLLKALAAKHPTRQLAAEKAEVARIFSELYSLVVQRWMQGKDTLSPAEKSELISVIVEVDQEVLASLGLPSGRIKSILERGGDLQREFEDLFGSQSRAGELGNRLRFSYTAPGGGTTTAPPTLSPPPAQVTQVPNETPGG